MFAATPPIEALKFIMSCTANQKGSERKTIIMSNDVRRAYFYAPSVRWVFIQILDEDYEEDDEDRCAELDFSMYGTRDASQCFDSFPETSMQKLGFTIGVFNPCIYWNEERDLVCV